MFWLAVASLLMLLSGTGDDTRAFRRHTQALEKAIKQHVTSAEAQQQALEAVRRNSRAFRRHRELLARSNECLVHADSSYEISRDDYLTCFAGLPQARAGIISEMIDANRVLRAKLSEEEWTAVQRAVTK